MLLRACRDCCRRHNSWSPFAAMTMSHFMSWGRYSVGIWMGASANSVTVVNASITVSVSFLDTAFCSAYNRQYNPYQAIAITHWHWLLLMLSGDILLFWDQQVIASKICANVRGILSWSALNTYKSYVVDLESGSSRHVLNMPFICFLDAYIQ